MKERWTVWSAWFFQSYFSVPRFYGLRESCRLSHTCLPQSCYSLQSPDSALYIRCSASGRRKMRYSRSACKNRPGRGGFYMDRFPSASIGSFFFLPSRLI